MALKATFADIELKDGSMHTVRVMLQDKLQFERTSRTHGWTEEKDPITSNLFLGWAAAKRTGITDAGFDQFKNAECVDFMLHQDAPPANDETATELDPTSESTND